jgi:hypothetical protein
MTVLTGLVRAFAQLLVERLGADLDSWMRDMRQADVPKRDSLLNGLDQDRAAVAAGLTISYGNGPTEGVNTKAKLIARQMYGQSRLHPTTPPHPPRIAPRSLTTGYLGFRRFRRRDVVRL